MSAKLAKYDRLYEQIKGYVQTTDDIWARLATMEAVLHHKMQTFFWTGVYALIDDELIVRSYQGPVACQKLRHHTGVCWAAVSTGETVIVPDVERFPGHIACNSKSRSEIVLPIRSSTVLSSGWAGKGVCSPVWMWTATGWMRSTGRMKRG